MNDICQNVDRLEQKDRKYSPFAAHLRNLAYDLEEKRILTLMKDLTSKLQKNMDSMEIFSPD